MTSLDTLIQAAGSAVRQDIIPQHNISVRAPATGQPGNIYRQTDVREVSLFVPTGYLVQGQRLMNLMPIDFDGDVHIKEEEGGYLVRRYIIAPMITAPALINVGYYSPQLSRCSVSGDVNNVILIDSDQDASLVYNKIVHPLFTEIDRLRGAEYPLTFIVNGGSDMIDVLRRLCDKARILPVLVRPVKKSRAGRKKVCIE